MLAKWQFGPPPRRPFLEHLGLAIPDDALRSGTALYDQAQAVLAEWTARRDRALKVAARLDREAKDRSRWGTDHRDLVEEAYHAGVRFWINQVFIRDVPTLGPAELRSWCLLQFEAFSRIRESGQAALFWIEKDLLSDADVLREAEPLLLSRPGDFSGGKAKGLKRFEDWQYVAGYMDIEYYLDLAARIKDEHHWSVKDPSENDYRAIVRVAWERLRKLGNTLGVPYPEEPTDIRDEPTCRSALDLVVQWCLERGRDATASEQGAIEVHKDEPEPPVFLWFNGERHEIPGKRLWQLLNCIWNRESISIRTLTGEVWNSSVVDSTVSTYCTRLNTALPPGFPWRVVKKGRYVAKKYVAKADPR
jgi:hypothetical protein